MADLTTELEAYGIDYTDAIDRFGGSADFYEKLALRYLDDSNYVNLVAAMEAEDYDAAYKAAHSLKGVSGNLSFARLFKVAAAASDALYQGEPQAAATLMPELKEAHEQVLAGLTKWQNGEL